MVIPHIKTPALERKKRSVWFRELVENSVVYGDRGYRGCEGVIVCGSREMRAKGR